MEPLILSIDCGTQSVRALLFDRYGELKGKKKVEFEPYISKNPGWAEQDPNVYYNAICSATKALKEEVEELWQQVIGVSITTQRDTCVNVDINGEPLRYCILWLDQRDALCTEKFSMGKRLAFRTVGMNEAVDITMRKSKSHWIKQNQPEIWQNTYKYLMLSGYLNYKLTGKFIDSIGNQVGHIPFDYKKKQWPQSDNSYKWHLFGVEREKLPQLIEVGDIIGKITEKASKDTGIIEGTAVIASASDKACETLGNGCMSSDCASISFGTTATVQTTSKEYFEPIPFMPAYPAAMKGYYNPEVEIFRGYWMITWFKKEFAHREMIEAQERNIPPEEVLNEKLIKIPPGSQGLMLQPYWTPGLKMPEAKGAIIGFSDVHTRAHIYRAIIEGINYGLLDGIDKIESKSHKKINKVFLSGGGSQSDIICEITSDMLNRPIYKVQTYETSGLGASIIAFVALGVYESYSEAIENMVNYTKNYKPNSENVKIYSQLYNNVYQKIYPALKGLYKEIREITGHENLSKEDGCNE
ncbi:FGGY-family carbohydrate kinase [Clostridium sp. MSJ-11]|uniref:FGGY-family carbohydrate kinase n=1 Tax=Clostridium mobile TaxID=2841512 RepID=A0ABS6EHJ6_9CLOT|nr:FGGY-family carbohydrate kinase [Clostridium mobile]MBU5484695.1 FGGY-family carbohydrate kinase [Clostridium mobile]